jgi:hypothetical protein
MSTVERKSLLIFIQSALALGRPLVIRDAWCFCEDSGSDN